MYVMKKLFVQYLCIAICLYFFVGSTVVSAQSIPLDVENNSTELRFAPVGENAFVGGFLKTLPIIGPAISTGSAVGAAVGSTQIGADLQQKAANAVFGPVVEGINQMAKEIILSIAYTISAFIAKITVVVGYIFDGIITRLTPTSDTWQINIQASIDSSWKILRDVASIILIFSLLYLGIKTILDGQGFADKKTLVSIIVAAILLNFSLIFTKDIAFILSNRIGHEILQTAKLNQTENSSFSASMMNMIGPQSLFDTSKGVFSPDTSMSGSSWGTIFGFLMQAIVLTFILGIVILIFSGLIGTLVVRFVIFIILMITSPIGIIASTIPWLKQYGTMWWDHLKKQTIFFPAFVFTMYIIFLLISNLGSKDVILDIGMGSAGAINTTVGFLMNYTLIIAFLACLLIIPSKIGGMGSGLISKTGGWASKKARVLAGGAAFGGAAWLGRNTVGRGASKLLSSDKLKLAAQNPKGFGGTAARALLRRADKAQNYSFDARGSKLGGDFAKKYGLGDAALGWKGTVDKKKKAYKDNMEKEKKMFGFEEMNDEQKKIHKQELNVAKANRSNSAKELQDENKKLEEARKNGASDAVIATISESITKKEKELEKFEKEVGKLMQAGDSQYIKYLKDQRHRGLNVYRRMSRSQKAALADLEKDMEKEWKSKGKAKQSKDNKKPPAVQTTTTTSSSGGGVTVI